jgi:hypothetical protein
MSNSFANHRQSISSAAVHLNQPPVTVYFRAELKLPIEDMCLSLLFVPGHREHILAFMDFSLERPLGEFQSATPLIDSKTLDTLVLYRLAKLARAVPQGEIS